MYFVFPKRCLNLVIFSHRYFSLFVAADCDFCTDYMLEDCYRKDVTYCKSHSCYVPEKCSAKKGKISCPFYNMFYTNLSIFFHVDTIMS